MRKNKKVTLNIAQLMASMAKQKQKFLEWGRGSGKTTYLGYDSLQLVKQMPRASFAMVGSTYSQILSRFMPAIKEGLELFGIYEGVDYVIGSMAGKKLGFKMPFQSPDSFNNIWHWANGCIFQFVSLDHKDSGRGLNSYAIRGDEAALFDNEKLAINVRNTNRAKKAIFKNAPLLHSEVFTSSTPLTRKGKWFTDMEELARKDPKNILFLKATAKVNLENLRSDYFEYMRQAYTNDFIYDAEMLNIRPKEITDGYYSQLTENHYYTDYDLGYLETLPGIVDVNGNNFNSKQDRDVQKNEPLIISVDWGASINAMTVSQLQGDTYRVLKEFFVKSPKILDHLFIEKFLPYYKYHQCKEVYFYYDRTGNNDTANSKMTYAEQAADILKKHGWTVYSMTTGTNPDYMDKFRLINVALKDDGRKNLPKVRINKGNCPNLIISMEHAEIYDRGRGLEKDKRSERRKSVDQEHATHLSDTFDYPFYSMFWDIFNGTALAPEDRPLSTFAR